MGDESDPLVLSNVENGVGYLTLNRPEAFNAMSLALAEQFLSAVEAMAGDDAVRAVVVRGEGRIFSAGGDIKQMLSDVEAGDRAAYFREPLSAFNRMALALRELPKPVVTAVHGAVAGAAFNFMLAADIIIAREGTKFNQAFVSVGVSPDCGGTWHLPRLAGRARAAELTMLPTEVTAEVALEWGLINRVVAADAFDEEVRDIAEALAKGPSKALARTKALLNSTYERSLADQMEAGRLAQVENAETEDFEEGLRAFTGKRKAEFKGR